MEITIKIDATPSLLTAIDSLVAVFTGATKPHKETVKKTEKVETVSPKDQVNAASSNSTGAEVKAVSLEEVRAAVQAKSDSHRDEIKALLAEFNAKNVTTLSKSDYEAFLQKINQL